MHRREALDTKGREAPRALRIGLLLASALFISACSGAANTQEADQGDAGGAATTAPSAGGDRDEPPPPDPSASPAIEDAGVKPPEDPCAIGAAPAGVVDVAMRFVALAQGAAMPVVAKGGDAKGTWRVHAATVYMPSSVARFIDAKASKGRLRGWAAFAGSDARVDVRADVTGVVLGRELPRQEAIVGRGVATYKDTAADIHWACAADGGPTDETVGYGIDGDRAVLIRKTPTTVGDVFLVLDATRVPAP